MHPSEDFEQISFDLSKVNKSPTIFCFNKSVRSIIIISVYIVVHERR